MEEKKEFTLRCRVCGNTMRGQGTREELEKWLDTMFGDCPAGGIHVELGKKRDYLEVLGESEELSHIPTPKEVLEELMERYDDRNIENWFWLGDYKVCEQLGLTHLQKVQGLGHIGWGDFRGGGYEYSRVKDIQEGRFYHRLKA